ncbi:hypothetical protein [Brevibacterium sp. CT2-23B]|uniref:hypothetical protein n=1 Tax=Brevibacterium sp. CT2-23B TaxID=2729630 RepID=UPI0015534D0A|nr:hypothetical protein [Brevibacterium sp. CT2-23B]
MTDQDNLRDRIAAVMYCHMHPLARMEDALRMARGEGMDSKRGQTNVVQRQYLPWAQAIIDEFGMTVDRAVDTGNRSYDKRTGIITNGWKYRVVGKWEKQ